MKIDVFPILLINFKENLYNYITIVVWDKL